MSKKKNLLEYLKEFWNFLWHDDSFLSYVLNFIVAFIFIKFIFFPSIGFVLDTDYPIAAIVSGSMEHKVVNGKVCQEVFLDDRNLDFDNWWRYCGDYYEKIFNLSKSSFIDFEYGNGLNIGDVLVLKGAEPSEIEVGDVLVFRPQDKITEDNQRYIDLEVGDSYFLNVYGPVIHRVVDKWEENGTWYYSTKGDHNPSMISEHNRLAGLEFEDFESRIPQEDVIGVTAFRVPYIGYAKILLNEVYLGLLRLF